jgi:nucleoside-diphosphate-sugar epimerase
MVSGVDYVIHNAGLVKANSEDELFAVNEQGTGNLFDAIAEHNPNVRKVIYVSSVAVAGPSRIGRPVVETDPPNPVSIYGHSKAAGEKVALSFKDKFPVVSVRPPAVYGPGDKEMFAIFKTIYRGLIPRIGNMSRRVQLVHVDDLCRGVFLAVTAKTESGAIYFLAERIAYTMNEMITLIRRASGRSGIPVVIPGPLFSLIAALSQTLFRLAGATPMLTRNKARELLASWEVSTSLARDELGYESVIPLEQGAQDTYHWYLQNGWL